MYAGFVHIMLGMHQCLCKDLTFPLLAQICEVHKCCTASDLNLILWVMTSVSLVNSGISYSEGAWSNWCWFHVISWTCPRAMWREPTLLLLCFLIITLCCSASRFQNKLSRVLQEYLPLCYNWVFSTDFRGIQTI